MMTDIQSFDVFLSHNSREKPAVERLAEKLKQAGLEPWLDKWCLTPGGRWQEELYKGLQASSSCAVFVGSNGIGAWEDEELGLALDRAAKDRAFRLFLVLLPDLSEPFDFNTLPPFLRLRTWVDLRKGLDNPRTFQLLINAIKGVAPGPETPIEPIVSICPYQGLEAFDEEHAKFFFGRQGEIQRLIEKLKTTRFLTVLGASGSGKSSVVRAGLIPALRKGVLPYSQTWNIQVLKPGSQPLTSLAAPLLKLDSQGTMQGTVDKMIEDPRTLHFAVSLAMQERPVGERVVWLIDQFEEVFTLCHDDKERGSFFDNLVYASSIPDGRNIILLTLRADFYQKCAAYPGLSAQIASQQFVVSQMDIEGLKQVVEEPAHQVGLELEEGLVSTILEDVARQPGALPLLEHALLELWERRRGRMLTLEGYTESGGVQGAIAKRADTIFSNFTAEQQAIVRNLMLRLTQLGEGTEDTRRQATINELVTRENEGAAVEKVIGVMTNERLLTMTNEQVYGQIVNVSHEALIRGWPRLRTWIDEDRAGLRIHNRLTESAREWQRLNRDMGILFRGVRLAEAVEWREKNESSLNPLEREFIEVSITTKAREEEGEKEIQRRELESARKLTEMAQGQAIAERRTRLVTSGFLLLSLILVAALVYYYPIRLYLLSQQAKGEMAHILEGMYPLGDAQWSEENPSWYLVPKKYHIASFSIDLYPVTNRRFEICVAAGVCSGNTVNYKAETGADRPVVNVTVIDAALFCDWLHMRLPSDKEWELAARNNVFKLVGGIWEWTRSPYDQNEPEWTDITTDPPEVLVQKGDSLGQPIELIMTFRQSTRSTYTDEKAGFRCASDNK